jgi:Protein of unknown function (DUF1826)
MVSLHPLISAVVEPTQWQTLTSDQADVLKAIRDEYVQLAIWRRSANRTIARLDLAEVRDLRFTSTLRMLPGDLKLHLAESGFRELCAHSLLLDDIIMLANLYAAIVQDELLEIRLDHVTTNACRKFHTDYVTARLICAYVGPGTEWLNAEDANSCGCGEAHNIQRMNTGDVGLFKGWLWSSKSPVIHRSPPIEGTGEERLVLVINTPPARD